MVQQVIALGISEVVLYYPALERQIPMLERIARDVTADAEGSACSRVVSRAHLTNRAPASHRHPQASLTPEGGGSSRAAGNCPFRGYQNPWGTTGMVATFIVENITTNNVENDTRSAVSCLSSGLGRQGFGRVRRSAARAAGTQLDHRARWRRQRLPSGDSSDVRSCLGVVGDPRKSPAQLDSSRQLALLAEDGADCIGIGLGDEEHPKSMVTRRTAGKGVP